MYPESERFTVNGAAKPDVLRGDLVNMLTYYGWSHIAGP